jgi:hypothetical protein
MIQLANKTIKITLFVLLKYTEYIANMHVEGQSFLYCTLLFTSESDLPIHCSTYLPNFHPNSSLPNS